MYRFLMVAALLMLIGGGCGGGGEVGEIGQGGEGGEIGEGEVGGVESVEDGRVGVGMESGNFFFLPAEISVAPGQVVDVNFVSNSGFHTFAIDEIGLDETIAEGEVISFTAPSAPGEYTFYCSIGSHRALGMVGTLIVE